MLPTGSFTRRTQFSSCDECRRLRVACNALQSGDGNASRSCTRCFNKKRTCTFNWLKDAKPAASSSRRKSLKSRSQAMVPDAARNQDPGSDSQLFAGRGDSVLTLEPSLSAQNPDILLLIADLVGSNGVLWLTNIFRGGFETIFGSWMGRYGCPFTFGEASNAETCVSISKICTQLDHWMLETTEAETSVPTPSTTSSERDRDSQAEQSLHTVIAAFAARWLPVTSTDSSVTLGNSALTLTLWRIARRDMLRVINRPSYRSMLCLFLFNLTPIPAEVSEDEELDGISGLCCVQTATQQVQILRARQRNISFSGSKISPQVTKDITSHANQNVIGTPEFITAESIALWTALTFDTSASLTLNCRSVLSAGLFGFGSEMSWQLVRTCAKIFDETANAWTDGSMGMTDERANVVVSAAAASKLLAWKLTAIFKESLRDGHEEAQVMKAHAAVIDGIREFRAIFVPRLEACHRRVQFLNQDTKLRLYHLMLHYYLSILILADIIEAANRPDLLAALAEAKNEAENAIMNTLVFGLQNTYSLSVFPSAEGTAQDDESLQASLHAITVPLVAVDPYSHHIVAGVQLVQKAIDRDCAVGKMTVECHRNLHWTLERTLNHLPRTSKSVLVAQARYSASSGTDTTDATAADNAARVVVHAEFSSRRSPS